MTKKSNNRRYKLGQPKAQRYQEYTLDIPTEVYDRLQKNLNQVIDKGLLSKDILMSEFILIVLANGIGMMEADLLNRERQTRLVLPPDEYAALHPRVNQRLPA